MHLRVQAAVCMCAPESSGGCVHVCTLQDETREHLREGLKDIREYGGLNDVPRKMYPIPDAPNIIWKRAWQA